MKIYKISDFCFSFFSFYVALIPSIDCVLSCACVILIFVLTLKSFQPVEVCVPYHRTKRREVVVQRYDGQSWSTLPTVLRRGSESHSSHPGGRPARVKYKTTRCKRVLFQLYFSFFLSSKVVVC